MKKFFAIREVYILLLERQKMEEIGDRQYIPREFLCDIGRSNYRYRFTYMQWAQMHFNIYNKGNKEKREENYKCFWRFVRTVLSHKEYREDQKIIDLTHQILDLSNKSNLSKQELYKKWQEFVELLFSAKIKWFRVGREAESGLSTNDLEGEVKSGMQDNKFPVLFLPEPKK